MFNKKTPIRKSKVYNNCTNFTLIIAIHPIVLDGNTNNDKPKNSAANPISVMMIDQLSSHILWKRIFTKPIIMAIKEVIIANF